MQFHEISSIIMECVDRFAPERELNSHYDQSDWKTNKIRNAIVKRVEFFHKLIKKVRQRITNELRKHSETKLHR